nr:MAG TPA: hypothetical protein [Caudoviricetes sp.]
MVLFGIVEELIDHTRNTSPSLTHIKVMPIKGNRS